MIGQSPIIISLIFSTGKDTEIMTKISNKTVIKILFLSGFCKNKISLSLYMTKISNEKTIFVRQINL